MLVSLRDFQDAKGDVIMKYTAEEARELKKKKWLPENGTLRVERLGPPPPPALPVHVCVCGSVPCGVGVHELTSLRCCVCLCALLSARVRSQD